jgi:hypothetical protein
LGQDDSFGIVAFGHYYWWVDFGLSLLVSLFIGNGWSSCTGVAQVVVAVAPHFDTTFGLQYFLRVLAISRETLN